MSETAIVPVEQPKEIKKRRAPKPEIVKAEPIRLAENIERVLIGGDLNALNAEDRVRYYNAVCKSLGLNPLTKPFDYITLNNKLTLYAKRDCTDQLRRIYGVSILDLHVETVGDIRVVGAKAQDKTGRTDFSTGAVNIKGLQGDALANAIMKAETKAKRRVTLSICGMGMLDETELETIPLDRTSSGNAGAGGDLNGAKKVAATLPATPASAPSTPSQTPKPAPVAPSASGPEPASIPNEPIGYGAVQSAQIRKTQGGKEYLEIRQAGQWLQCWDRAWWDTLLASVGWECKFAVKVTKKGDRDWVSIVHPLEMTDPKTGEMNEWDEEGVPVLRRDREPGAEG